MLVHDRAGEPEWSGFMGSRSPKACRVAGDGVAIGCASVGPTAICVDSVARMVFELKTAINTLGVERDLDTDVRSKHRSSTVLSELNVPESCYVLS
jgi:hypothetical protein